MNSKDEKNEAESRRILQRVSQESDPGGSLIARTARRARDHINAEDADKGDWAEYWGTRIGRGLGIGLVVLVVAWFIHFLMGG